MTRSRVRLALLLLCVQALLSSACGRVSSTPSASGPAGDYRLWQDASIFVAVRSLLAAAGPGQALWVEMYEFDRPDLARALLDGHRRGADVRIVVDRTVPESARTADQLAAAGLPIRAYPVDDGRHQIDHLKLLISGGVALVGGMNWGRRSAANHDYAFEVALPPVVSRLRSIFEQDWSLAGGQPSPLPSATGPVAQTAPGEEVRALLIPAIQSSTASVMAELFVLTDPDVLVALTAAHRRGARVRILLDPGQDSNLFSFRILRAASVEVRWYRAPRGKLHAKAGLFDGRRLLLGSANWSQGGLSVNHELDLLADDPRAAAAFEARFERDWEVSG